MVKTLKEKMPEPMEEELFLLGKISTRRIILAEDMENLSIRHISKILIDALKRYHLEKLLDACFDDFSSNKLGKLQTSLELAKNNDKANCITIFKELEKRFRKDTFLSLHTSKDKGG